MRLSIKTMLGCDGVVVLSDWEGSKGAKLEHDVAIACGLHVHNFLIWMNRASSWAHRSPDYSDGENSPEEAQNTAPSDEALSAPARRMDETNALLRAIYKELGSLNLLVSVFMLDVRNGPKRMVEDMTEKAALVAKEAAALYESVGKENADDRKA